MRTELLKYATYVLKRIWIVLLVGLVLGAAAFWFFSRRPAVYTAETQVLIGRVIFTPDPDTGEFELARRLGPTYVQLLKSEVVMLAAIEVLANLPESRQDADDPNAEAGEQGEALSPAENQVECPPIELTLRQLQGRVSARQIIDTSIIRIEATDADPIRAKCIVDVVTDSLIDNSPSNLTEDEQQQLALLNRQIQPLEAQVTDLRDGVISVGQRLEEARTAGDSRTEFSLQEEYNELTTQLNNAQATLAQFSDAIERITNRANRLVLLEYAQPPTSASRTNPILASIIGTLAGAAIATAAILLYLEYIDSLVRTESDLTRSVDVPVLGQIPLSRSVRAAFRQNTIAPSDPNSKFFEGLRKVLVRLFFSSTRQLEDKVILIASPQRSEGRSLVLANLAKVATDSGLRVLMLDANLREPVLDKLFKVSNQKGLTGLLTAVNENIKVLEDDTALADLVGQFIQKTSTHNLEIITSGVEGTPISAHILGFEYLGQCIDILRGSPYYDVIFIDTPPAMLTSDSYLIALTSRANVVLLVEAAKTDLHDVMKVNEQFTQLGVKVRGITLNKT